MSRVITIQPENVRTRGANEDNTPAVNRARIKMRSPPPSPAVRPTEKEEARQGEVRDRWM